MYLVTPSVYEKLLTCIDEKDKRMTEELNNPPETSTTRPSELMVQDLSREDILPETEILEPPVEIESSGQVTNQPELIAEQTGVDEPQAIVPVINNPNQPVVYNCPFCQKVFTRPFSVNRHIERYHTSLKVSNIIEQPLPVTSTSQMDPARITAVKTKPTVAFASDESVPQMSDIQHAKLERVPISQSKRRQRKVILDDDDDMPAPPAPPQIRQKCIVSSDNTTRCIPDVQPSTSTNKPILIMPSIMPSTRPRGRPRKNILNITKPNITKRKSAAPKLKANIARKVVLKLPSKKSSGGMEIGDFENWSEKRKRGARTASEAKLRMKPTKKIANDDGDFERWT
jgi:hypothetical protein